MFSDTISICPYEAGPFSITLPSPFYCTWSSGLTFPILIFSFSRSLSSFASFVYDREPSKLHPSTSALLGYVSHQYLMRCELEFFSHLIAIYRMTATAAAIWSIHWHSPTFSTSICFSSIPNRSGSFIVYVFHWQEIIYFPHMHASRSSADTYVPHLHPHPHSHMRLERENKQRILDQFGLWCMINIGCHIFLSDFLQTIYTQHLITK